LEEDAMSTNLAFALQTGDDDMPEAGLAYLAPILFLPLDLAGGEVERDAEKARTVLRRASSILRFELEGRSGEAGASANLGELDGKSIALTPISTSISRSGSRTRI
jgi:hypothetical protein